MAPARGAAQERVSFRDAAVAVIPLSGKSMTLALHAPTLFPPHQRTAGRPTPARVGDTLGGLAQRYAAEMNASVFATALRNRRLATRSYVAFIATMYPVVVGFNRSLIRSVAKG